MDVLSVSGVSRCLPVDCLIGLVAGGSLLLANYGVLLVVGRPVTSLRASKHLLNYVLTQLQVTQVMIRAGSLAEWRGRGGICTYIEQDKRSGS